MIENVKQKIARIADELSPEASFEDALEKIFFIYKIEKGLKEIEEGNVVSHEEVEKQVNEWFK